MVRKTVLGIFFGGLIFCSAVMAGSGLNVEDGMWDITSVVKMPGMTIPSMTISQCITKDNAIPQSNSPGQDECRVSDIKTSGNTVSWTTICDGQGGKMTGKGEVTYHGNRFEGRMTTEHMGMVIVTEMSGKRTGPCK